MNECDCRCDPHHKTPDLSRVEDRSELRKNTEARDHHHQSRRLTLPSSSSRHEHVTRDNLVTDNPGYESHEERDEDISEHVARSRRSRSLHLVHRQERVMSESSSERPDVSPGLGRITDIMAEKEVKLEEEEEEEPDLSPHESTEGFTNLRGVSSRSVGSIAQAVLSRLGKFHDK